MRRMLVLFVLTLLPFSLSAATRPSDAEIRALVDANMHSTEAGDLDSLLETIHPDSIAYPNMREALDEMKAYKVKCEAVTVEYVGMAGEYALIRVLQRTKRISGPPFQDNEIDGVWALKLDGKKWKYWFQMTLAFKRLMAENE